MLPRSQEVGEALNLMKATGLNPFAVSVFFQAGGGFNLQCQPEKVSTKQVTEAWQKAGNVSDNSHAISKEKILKLESTIKELTKKLALSEAKCQETEAIAVKKGEEAAQMIVSLKKEV